MTAFAAKILLVFLMGLLIDVMYIMWFMSVAARKRLRAGVASVFLAAPNIFGFLAIVDDIAMAVPYLAGLFFGTIIGIELDIWLKRRKKRREKKRDSRQANG